MPVTYKEQRAGHVHRQVDGDAFNDFVEVHISAEAAGIARDNSAAEGCCSNTSEHGTKLHGEGLQVIARALAGCNHALAVETPANILPSVLEFYSHTAVNGAVNDGVIADGVISIQSNAREVYGERVTGPRGLNVERSGLRIAAQRSRDAAFIRAAGINRGGVNSVARPDPQHGLRRSGEFPMESCWREFVALRTTARHRLSTGGYCVFLHILRIVRERFDELPRERPTAQCSGAFDGAEVVASDEVQDVALQCALDLLS